MARKQDAWQAGATWVFQGTVLEDATVGTHTSTLTVTPGAGNEIELQYGRVSVAGAVGPTVIVLIDDGTNEITRIVDAVNVTAGSAVDFPSSQQTATSINTGISGGSYGMRISGTMRLILKASTTSVSATQTFAVACRIKGAMPTATLADSLGTPTLTTNTSAVF